MKNNSNIYQHPKYYALGYRWNTGPECDFIEGCLEAYGPKDGKRLLDLGCGAGRHAFHLAGEGYQVKGIDIQPEMVDFVKEQAQKLELPVTAEVADLHTLEISGTYDAAYCFKDTFRFLLSNEDIIAHLRRVSELLVPGGLYLTDFWVPRQWDQAGSEVFQWEQEKGSTKVKVFYVQHPDTIDPVKQTFEEELVLEVYENEEVKEIRGGRTRTRLLLPQEFRSLVGESGVFEWMGSYSDFALTRPLERASMNGRMISVMRRQ